MRKEYRNAIICMIACGLGYGIIKLITGQISWRFLIISSITAPFSYLYGLRIYKKREAKIKEKDQRRE